MTDTAKQQNILPQKSRSVTLTAAHARVCLQAMGYWLDGAHDEVPVLDDREIRNAFNNLLRKLRAVGAAE